MSDAAKHCVRLARLSFINLPSPEPVPSWLADASLTGNDVIGVICLVMRVVLGREVRASGDQALAVSPVTPPIAAKMAAAKANFAALAKLVADVLVSDDDDGEIPDLQSEEELEETSDLAVAAVLVAQIIREDRHRVRLYVESVVDSYSDEEFRRLFRLQRCTTEVITADFKFAGGYLLGDAAYPLLPWLLPPYRHVTSSWQPWMSKFNHVHSKQRVVVEIAFGLLKGRFRREDKIDVNSIPQTVEIVMAACVLHNLARRHADIFEDSDIANSDLGIFSSEPVDVDHKPT
ncbi:uncharacterized protein LOC119185193 [Rhipicephalus microplus]|uniref:uncharacterized protein LOC119185193 n=1 Tax=Rhipicephalus microplus TaxID=6941 RepID=UPI003F6B0342